MSVDRISFRRLIAGIFVSFATLSSLGAQNNVKEPLKEMPWYDKSRDDYRKYRPEDVKIPKEEEQRQAPVMRGPGIAIGSLRLFVIVLLTALGIFILYLLYRRYRDRSPGLDSIDGVHAGTVTYSGLPSDENRGEWDPWQLFEDALRRGDLRAAAVFLYGTAVSGYRYRGLLPEGDHLTARDFVRRLSRSKEAGEDERRVFAGVARVYEAALYADIAPPEERIREMKTSLDGLGIVGGGKPA